jgi:hypothetical protein
MKRLMRWIKRKTGPQHSFYLYHAMVRRLGLKAATVIVRDSFNIRLKEKSPEKVRQITGEF